MKWIKIKNIDYLYFAAGSAVNGKDYDLALEYYVKLKIWAIQE